MTDDVYIIAITALLPLMAGLLVLQTNPYYALVIRGILGAVAALVYALFGAADVALTEALVGTMLSITLYAVAVRSSMRMRLGILENEHHAGEMRSQSLNALLATLRKRLSQHHLSLEPVSYATEDALQTALAEQDIHATLSEQTDDTYDLQIRVPRLQTLLQTALPDTPHLRLPKVGGPGEPTQH